LTIRPLTLLFENLQTFGLGNINRV
jgi:hypothetical protein